LLLLLQFLPLAPPSLRAAPWPWLVLVLVLRERLRDFISIIITSSPASGAGGVHSLPRRYPQHRRRRHRHRHQHRHREEASGRRAP
jgi:hypothetical protein